MDKKIWKDPWGLNEEGIELGIVPGSNLGISRDGKLAVNVKTNKVLTLTKTNKGYMVVTNCIPGKQGATTVHRAVALAWIGEPPEEGSQVDHINRDRLDNRVENLRWTTQQENLENRNLAGAGPLRNEDVYSKLESIEKEVHELKDLLEQLIKATNK